MRNQAKRLLSSALALLIAVQLLPVSALAASAFEHTSSGTELFKGENNEPRLFVSETAYPLAPGVTEYVTYTNERSGLNQNIDFFCEVDLNEAEIMAGYANMEGILADNEISWRMQTVSEQVKNTQSYFDRSEDYADATIVAALNADFYNMATGEPTGALIIDGKSYHDVNGRYYFGITKDGEAIISNNSDTSNLNYAVGGSTLLLQDGQVQPGTGGRNVTYSAIGIKADGTVVSMVCYGQRYPVSCGYTQYEVANMMKARGCVTALMLDGSGSSTFVSRREGESAVTTRNNPSDGQERQVSSSLFIVSREKSDGVFDHASITPANEVYTPGSTVNFTAVGADKSGGPAPLPSGLTWTVDAGYGSINNATGAFTSNGKTGDVTVYLNQGGTVVGQTTITIANPDQITFAEETASIGQGDTSDLGLRVYYKQREVHYKDGDLDWKIEPTQYSRKEYVNSTYNYNYKGTNGTVRTDPHSKGTTTTMQPPTELLSGDDLNELKLSWVGGALDPNYTPSWVFVSHNYQVVTETAQNAPGQMDKLSLGEVSDNKLTCNPVYSGANQTVPGHDLTDNEKAASAITAKVTVSSKADPDVSGTVTVEACKDPVVAMDFEQDEWGDEAQIFHGLESYAGQFDENGNWTEFDTPKTQEQITQEGYDYTCVSYAGRTTDGRQVGKAQVVSRAEGYPVRFGEYSMRLDYDFSTNNGQTDGACFGPTEDIVLTDLGNPTRIGLWVYIPKNTPNLWLRLQYRDGSGNASQLDFTENDIYRPNNVARNADDNWHYFEADISHLQTPVTIPAGQSVRVMMANPKQSIGAAKLWASPVGWVKCQTDENGNIILVDKNDERLTEFVGGYTTTPLNIGAQVPDQVTLGTTGETVTIDKVPIPEYLATFNTDGTTKTKGNLSGTLYFDNVTYIYGSSPEDTNSPQVSSITVQSGGNDPVALTNGMTLTDGALTVEAEFSDDRDDDTGVASASLYVDQRQVESATVDMGAGILKGGVKLSNGSHTIRVSVVDNYGNETSRSYTVTVNDPEGAGAPVTVTAIENDAVLGGKINLQFTPRDTSVNTMTVTVDVPADYAQGYTLTHATDCEVSAQSYNSVTEQLTFTANGTVSTGPMVTLTLKVPATAAVGERLTLPVNGSTGTESFNATPSWMVSAPYTVTSGQMVAGLADTCWFQINHTGGEAAAGVDLYSGNTKIGTSDATGRVKYEPTGSASSITVTAKDNNGGVSAAYITPIRQPQGNNDGTPTKVWRNAADAADTLNVSWMANPVYANNTAMVKIAENVNGLAEKTITAECQLVTFSDNAAAYVCSAEVDELTPGKTYYYQVGDGEHWSDVRSFTTVAAGSGIDALVLGDLQENDNTNLSGILDKVGTDKLDLVLQTGDLVDEGGSYALWNNTLSMLDRLGMNRLFALGNHELEGGLDPNTVIYNQNSSSYYAIETGNVFVATITYNSFSETTLNQLIADAQASTADWKILVTHQPPYYTNVQAGMAESMQKSISDACQQAGIDVVLSGHDHSYARTEPLLNGQVVDANEGITYFICGSLGEKSYAVTNTEGFHFAKLSDNYDALYMTLNTTASSLTINVYDYKGGNPELIDSFTKSKVIGCDHESYTWDGTDTLTCSVCGATLPAASYTGFAAYQDGRVYFNAGKLMTGWFAVGSEGKEETYHASDNGLLHNSETVNTAQCWEDGNLICWCHDCNKYHTFSETRRQGHLYDENHVCTRQVFNMDDWEYEVCGFQAKDITDMEIELAYQYGAYTGEARRPAVTVTDPETGEEYFGQSTYGDYMPYWENNINVGTATVRIVGYADGPILGETTVTFQIVPQNVTAQDFTVTTTSNSAHVTWKPASGATHYIFYQQINGEWTRLGIVDEPEYTVTGLSAGEYQFMVRPFATVDGQDYYSTKNSDVVTVTIEGGGVTFAQNGTVTHTYGDSSFTNVAQLPEGASGSFTYFSADTGVATVNASTGEVTIVGAGSTVITAKLNDGLEGQYRLTVKPKEVTLTWTGTEARTYNGQPAAVTAMAGGLVGNDTVTVTVTDGDKKDAGTHTAVATGLSSGNYALPENCTAEYVINPVTLTNLTWSGDRLTYTGQPIAPTVTGATGLLEGDEVTFSVPKATEPGTYQVTAVSGSHNYVVSADEQPYTFTIALPTITLAVNGGTPAENIAASMKDGIIVLSGFVASEETVITVNVTGSQTASTTVSMSNPTATVNLAGVNYQLDGKGLAIQPANVTLNTGATVTEVPELSLDDNDKAALDEAANASDNKFSNIIGAIASAVDELVSAAQEKVDEPVTEFHITVSQSLKVKEYKPGESYKVDIKPVYTITATTGEDGSNTVPISSGELSNEQIAVSVEVSLKVPTGITLGEHTFIKHYLSENRWEYIKPTIEAGNVLTFWTDSFSEFEVVSDSRTGRVTFHMDEGNQTRVFTPANLGDTLPVVEKEGYTFDGWTIGDTTYKEVTEEFLDAVNNTTIEAKPEFTENETPEQPPVDNPDDNPGGNTGTGSGGGGGGGGAASYTVSATDSAHGTVSLSATSASKGETVTVTVTPEDGYKLSAISVTTQSGEELTVTKVSDTVYSFLMPDSKVTVTVSFVEQADVSMPFTDVTKNDWYYDAVAYVYEKGIMNGTDYTSFSPTTTLSRAMLAQVLYNLSGQPESSDSSFADVPSSAWYADAVGWAATEGVVTGYSNNIFGPENPVTREQMAAMFYRYAAAQGDDMTAKGNLDSFVDSEDTSAWAVEAMQWAVAEGLISGKNNGILDPKGTATRAEVATILMRFTQI